MMMIHEKLQRKTEYKKTNTIEVSTRVFFGKRASHGHRLFSASGKSPSRSIGECLPLREPLLRDAFALSFPPEPFRRSNWLKILVAFVKTWDGSGRPEVGSVGLACDDSGGGLGGSS
jgi:hypothetical protein